MLVTKNLSFNYGKQNILDNVNFIAEKGQVISLIGPNGSGKSTLLRCLCGLIPVKRSSVFLFDRPIETLGAKEIARKVAFLPQSHERLQGVTVYELVSMGRAPYHRSGWVNTKEDQEKIAWAIDYMQIGHLTHRLAEMLSGGEKQRAWIAMVLAQDTPIILLDEPVTYMDLKYQCELLRTIKDLKDNFQKTVVAVFHDINHAIEISDSVYLLKNGHVYKAGGSEQVITEQAIKDVYGVYAHICKFKRCCRNVVVPAGVHDGSMDTPLENLQIK
ncbi:iron complex transport system ATP-binding protein [Anaerovirgula multivorans]|uniref:Iron complex transport system ATP-binding protein n=1 Tax=Anaerovirgula multivorans TaxID=312168 RepID=A0A239CFM1_9FIRM|nr:ABC transporter ATP-binding protein [Anaerovirgula multivorans]SNS19015.1 iron complex transport system ATP-binding protein [Anaerovirgula multivorans]